MTLDFIAALMFMKNIILKTSRLAESLQAEDLNIVDALSITRATITALSKIQSDDKALDDQITASCRFSETLDIDTAADYERL